MIVAPYIFLRIVKEHLKKKRISLGFFKIVWYSTYPTSRNSGNDTFFRNIDDSRFTNCASSNLSFVSIRSDVKVMFQRFEHSDDLTNNILRFVNLGKKDSFLKV